MTRWSDGRMIRWLDGQKTRWPEDRMARSPDDRMARRPYGQRPYGQKSRWHIKQILKKWCSQCYTGNTPNVLPGVLEVLSSVYVCPSKQLQLDAATDVKVQVHITLHSGSENFLKIQAKKKTRQLK